MLWSHCFWGKNPRACEWVTELRWTLRGREESLPSYPSQSVRRMICTGTESEHLPDWAYGNSFALHMCKQAQYKIYFLTVYSSLVGSKVVVLFILFKITDPESFESKLHLVSLITTLVLCRHFTPATLTGLPIKMLFVLCHLNRVCNS